MNNNLLEPNVRIELTNIGFADQPINHSGNLAFILFF